MSLSNYNPGQELASIDFAGLIGGPLGAIVDAQSKAALSTVDFVKSIGFTPDSEDETTGEITPGEPIYVKFKYPKMVQPYQPKVEGLIKTLDVVKVGSTTVSDADSIVSVSISGGTGGSVTASVNASDGIDLVIADAGEGYSTSDKVTIVYMDTDTPSQQQVATADITALDERDAVPAVFEEMKLEVPILTMMPIPFIRVDEGEIDFNAKITSMEYARVGSELKVGSSASFTNQNTNTNYSFLGSFNKNKNTNTVKLKTNISYQRNTRRGHKIDKTFHLGVKIRVTQEEMPEGMERLLGILEDSIVSQPTQ